MKFRLPKVISIVGLSIQDARSNMNLKKLKRVQRQLKKARRWASKELSSSSLAVGAERNKKLRKVYFIGKHYSGNMMKCPII